MARAAALEAVRPQKGARAWARIDREITERAALVPYVNLRQIDFVSARLRGYQHHPFLGLIADQAWLRLETAPRSMPSGLSLRTRSERGDGMRTASAFTKWKRACRGLKP